MRATTRALIWSLDYRYVPYPDQNIARSTRPMPLSEVVHLNPLPERSRCLEDEGLRSQIRDERKEIVDDEDPLNMFGSICTVGNRRR